jgi:hypothetical protein
VIKLLAKNKTDGRYYFTEDESSVYLIKPPFTNEKKSFIDTLPVFLRKSIDADIVYEEREFGAIEELVVFAINDSKPENRYVELSNQLQLDDLLIYAPKKMIEEYYSIIEDMINRKEFVGIDVFFKQLAMNDIIIDSHELSARKDQLMTYYDNARFANIANKRIANNAEVRIRKSKNVLSVA